ncbi:DUF1284 domain-containing protein [Pararhizobium arenae]|uniref:DUF1284 domain-containing protein n=1 Tax=Pararhizobium arenae TaxID=1856850 RepID=UPI00094B286C|nr:DUF1284 domain-containing protein [Pararhizobium arenae]
MTVRLRAHHLLCLLTYVGKGYTPTFVANYDRIAARLSAGEEILIVDGPDDICAPLLHERESHCHHESVGRRDIKAAEDVGRILDLALSAGTLIEPRPSLIERMRAGFAAGDTRTACAGCEWFELCSTISGNGYQDALIHPPHGRVIADG